MSDPKIDPVVSLQKRAAVNKSWSNTQDWAKRTEPAREAFQARWEKQVDPDGVLDLETRSKLAEKAKLAHYQMMAAKSARVRRGKKAAKE